DQRDSDVVRSQFPEQPPLQPQGRNHRQGDQAADKERFAPGVPMRQVGDQVRDEPDALPPRPMLPSKKPPPRPAIKQRTEQIPPNAVENMDRVIGNPNEEANNE